MQPHPYPRTGGARRRMLVSSAALLVLALSACSHAISVESGNAIPFRLEYLLDDSHAYKYVGDRSFLTMRDALSHLHLQAAGTELHGDSVALGGTITDSQTGRPLSGVEVYSGGFDSRTGMLSGMKGEDPTSISTYRITANRSYTTDSSGIFELHARIEPQSLLILAKPGYLLLIYKIGRLVDS